MKVLHLLPTISPGGAPINTLRTISELNSVSHVIAAFWPQSSENPFIENGFDFHNVDLKRPRMWSIIKLLNVVFSEKPDIVHGNGKSGVFYLILLQIIFPNLKTVITYRGFHSQYSGLKRFVHLRMERLGHRLFKKLIFVSDSEHDHYSKILQIEPCKNKVKIIPNGIVIPKHEKYLVPFSVSTKTLNIVTIARLDKQKDLGTALCAIKLLKRQLKKKKIMLDIYSVEPDKSNPYFKSIKKQILEMDIGDQINFIFGKPNACIFLKYYDIFISSSVFEGLPTSLIEAGLSEIPIVCSDCRGNIDVMKNFKRWVFETGNEYDLCKKIEKLNKLSLDQKGFYAKKLNKEFSISYSLKNQSRKIMDVYRSIG